MKVTAVWTEEIAGQIPEQKEEEIEKFLEFLDCMDDKQIDIFLDEDALYGNEDFCEWIYSRNQPDMVDMKRELLRKINRYQKVEKEEHQSFLREINQNSGKNTFGVDFREDICFYAASGEKLYRILRDYLKREKCSDFIGDLEFCFPNLYFDESVSGSVHTLNRRFEEIRGEIVDHLAALDSYQPQFLELSKRNVGYQEIAVQFERDSGIECSTQSGRKQVIALKRNFWDEVNQEMVSVTCELHTKFKRYNIDKTKQDRIYFAPAKLGVKKERVIIVHIGKHL